jgi:hypothetical protein
MINNEVGIKGMMISPVPTFFFLKIRRKNLCTEVYRVLINVRVVCVTSTQNDIVSARVHMFGRTYFNMLKILKLKIRTSKTHDTSSMLY